MTTEHILRNLSNDELITLIENGNASATELELIRRYYKLDVGMLDIDKVRSCVKEAKRYFPGEDFLSGAIARAIIICKKMRGANKTDLQKLIDLLTEIETDTIGYTQQSIEELDNIFKE